MTGRNRNRGNHLEYILGFQRSEKHSNPIKIVDILNGVFLQTFLLLLWNKDPEMNISYHVLIIESTEYIHIYTIQITFSF